MTGDETLYLKGTGHTKSVYQQSSTGEKHVIFYPTNPAPSVTSEERRSWCQASSSLTATKARINHHIPKGYSEGNTGMTKSKGGAPDPSDSRGPSTETDTLQSRSNFKIGIYGWRKKCLYILIFMLIVMVVVNLSLTLWVLKVMEFSSEGMGQLKIVSGGVKLEGKAFVLGNLIASSIKSRTGQPIVVESSRNLTLKSRNKDGYLDSSIFIGNERFECMAKKFKVTDDQGVLLFSADKHSVIVGSESLRVEGEGGTKFSGSIQTTLVRSHAGHDLRLESPTRSFGMFGPKGIHLESRGGKIETIALSNITFNSEVGAVRLQSSSILMPLLPTAKIVPRPLPVKKQDIYQLCVCENGKLFLAAPHSVCASENDDRLCR